MSNNNSHYPNLDNSDDRNLFSQNKGGEGNNTQVSYNDTGKISNPRVIDINDVNYTDYPSKVNNNNKLKCEDTIPEEKTDTSEELINDLLNHGEKLTDKNKELETKNKELQEQKAHMTKIIYALNEKVRVMKLEKSFLKDELNKFCQGSFDVYREKEALKEDLSKKLKCSQDEIVAWKLANDDLTKENKKLNDELKLNRESGQSAAKDNYNSFIAKIILDEKHKSLRCFVALSGCLLGLTYTILPFAISTIGMFMMGFGVLFLASSALLIYGSVKERLDKDNDDEKTKQKNFWCKKLSGLILGIGLVLLGIVGLVCPGLFLSYMCSQIVVNIFYSVSIAVGAYLLKCFDAMKIREYQQNEPKYLFDKDGEEKPMSGALDRNIDSPELFHDGKNIDPNNIDNDYPKLQEIVNNNIGILPQDFFPQANSELLDDLPEVDHVLSKFDIDCRGLTN